MAITAGSEVLAVVQKMLAAEAPFEVVTGTTSGTINTANLKAHGCVTKDGKAVTPRAVLAYATTGAIVVYQGAAPDATNIDVRSATASIAYTAVVLY